MRSAPCVESLERRLLLSAGDPDPTFGTGGLVTAGPGDVDSSFADVKVLPNGRILAVGRVYPPAKGGSEGMYLARFLPDGSPDPTFGDHGSEIVTAGGLTSGNRIALADGQFYVAGNTGVARFNSDGSLDMTFGSGGVAAYNDGFDVGSVGVVVQPDGKVVVVHGPVYTSGTNQGLLEIRQFPYLVPSQTTYGDVIRYLPSGALDTTFGNGGRVSDFHADNSNWIVAAPTDVAIQGGQIIVSVDLAWFDQTPYHDFHHAFGAERLNPDGSTDFTFGDHGVGVAEFSGDTSESGDYTRRVKVAPDGSIDEVGVSGWWYEFHFDHFNPDGTGGTDHFVVGGGTDAQGSDLVFQPDGKVIVFGYQDDGLYNGSPCAARFNSDFRFDPSYDNIRTYPEFSFFIEQPGGADIDSQGRLIGCGAIGYRAVLIWLLGDGPTGVVSGAVNVPGLNGDQLSHWVVYADLDGNGTHDPGEPSALSSEDTTDQLAHYQMDLPPGTYTIRQQSPDGWAQQQPANNAAYQVTLSAGRKISGNDFAVTPLPGRISGTVYVDVNNDNKFEAGDIPIAGATVFFDKNANGQLDAGEPSIVTGVDGSYIMEAPPFETQDVQVQLPAGYKLVSPTGFNGIAAQPGENVTGVDFRAASIASSPPPVGNPNPNSNPPSSNPPPPETLAGDRAALRTARLDARGVLAVKQRQLRLDHAAFAQARRALRRAHVAARHSGAAVDPSLQADVDRLDETVAGDRAALASAKASGLAAIRAARRKLSAFLVRSRVGGSRSHSGTQ